MFLALDPATKTGWAAWKPGMEKPASGSFDLSNLDTDIGKIGYDVHVNLSRLHQVHGFERIYYEQPIPPGQMTGSTNFQTIAIVFCIASHIDSYAYAKNLRCRVVGQGQWRRSFLGRGRGATSGEFKAWARTRCRELGWRTRSHDEADALGILDHAIGLDESINPPWRDGSFLFQSFEPRKLTK